MNPVDFEIPVECSREVLAALEAVGRTEDLRFAPSNRRFALAGFGHQTIALADVAIDGDGCPPEITVLAVREFTSPHLHAPHGVEFLDETTIVVANRKGAVALFAVPADLATGSDELVPVEAELGRGFPAHDSPSAVRLGRASDGDGVAEVFVCDNRGNAVTRHAVTRTNGRFAAANDGVLRRWLVVPDGVAVDRDRWLAVSNHDRQVVMLYERAALSDERAAPSAVLRGVAFPHGMRFNADGTHLFVADAGSPYVHVFARPDDGWRGVQYPTLSVRVMDDDTFVRGRFHPHEGGPKGLDLDRTGRILTVTCEFQRLRCFDVAAVTAAAPEDASDATRRAVEYELSVLDETDRVLGVAERRALEIERSRSYRVTAPLRWLNGAFAGRLGRKLLP